MSLKQTIAPAEEPVSLTEAKAYARVDDLDDDDMVSSLIATARQQAETVTGRPLVTQTWQLKADAFPRPLGNGWYRFAGRNARRDAIVLPLPPLQSVTSITYVDDAGVTQTLDPATYAVDAASEPARITLAYGCNWPTTRCVADAVTITFVAGYGPAAAVPDAAKTYIKMMVARHFDADVDADVRKAIEWILSPLLWGSYS